MKLKGPIVTLFAGVVFAVIVLLANMNATRTAAAARGAGTPPVGATGTATPTVAPSTPAAVTTAPVASLPPGTYAGHTTGGGASIAIAVHKGVAIAYLCSGKIESWLQGDSSATGVTLTGNHKGTLTATLTGDTLKGTATASGKTFTFSIKVVAAPSGLYRAAATVRGAKVVAGWVVLPDGTQVGMVDTDGIETTAPALPDGHTATLNGAPVTAAPVDGSVLTQP